MTFGSNVARLATALALGFLAPCASGATCPGETPALASVDSEVRLRFLLDAFDWEIRNVDAWSWTWASVYAAAAVTQGAIIPFANQGVRTDLAVGTVSAGIGSLTLFALPLEITLPLRSARRAGQDIDPCQRLARTEAALATGAGHEALGSGPLPHVGNVLANLAIALILGLGYDRWKSAAISAGVGTVVGEANAFTQPHRLPGVLERYRAGTLASSSAPIQWSVALGTVKDAWSASLQMRF
jgi:hypothetical protein